MKKIVVLIALVAILTGAAGWFAGKEAGYKKALKKVGDHLFIETVPPPWSGHGDAGLTLCIALTPAEKAGTPVRQCLQEVRPQEEAEVEQTEAEKILEEMQYPPPGNGGR